MKKISKPAYHSGSVPRGVLARYAAILDAIAPNDSGLSLTQIMRVTGLSSATTYRLLAGLVDVGYLSVDQARKTYSIAPRLLRLFHLARSRATISTLAQPALQSLVARFSETAFLARLHGLSVETVSILSPDNHTQSYVQPGRVMPINAAASAKAVFAFQPERVVSQALRNPMQKYTPNTIVSRPRLMREFKAVRAQGFAVCADELDHGVLSYACPVDLTGVGVIYSIGLVALSERLNRFDQGLIVNALRAAASTLAHRLEAASPSANLLPGQV
jgi:IclR family transcriptional regulator, acetate operon repressor